MKTMKIEVQSKEEAQILAVVAEAKGGQVLEVNDNYITVRI